MVLARSLRLCGLPEITNLCIERTLEGRSRSTALDIGCQALITTLHILSWRVSDANPKDWFGCDDLEGLVEWHDGAPEGADRGPTLSPQ
jgi:hypothetical protein